MIGCTWMDGRGQLFSEAYAYVMLYTFFTYILYKQLILILLAPSSMCIKRIQNKSDC